MPPPQRCSTRLVASHVEVYMTVQPAFQCHERREVIPALASSVAFATATCASSQAACSFYSLALTYRAR